MHTYYIQTIIKHDNQLERIYIRECWLLKLNGHIVIKQMEIVNLPIKRIIPFYAYTKAAK